MGADDDADCAGHVWVLAEVVIGRGADKVTECARCGATRYEAGQATRREDRPPL